MAESERQTGMLQLGEIYQIAKERAWNNLNNLLPLPPGEGRGEGIKYSSYFVLIPNALSSADTTNHG